MGVGKYDSTARVHKITLTTCSINKLHPYNPTTYYLSRLNGSSPCEPESALDFFLHLFWDRLFMAQMSFLTPNQQHQSWSHPSFIHQLTPVVRALFPLFQLSNKSSFNELQTSKTILSTDMKTLPSACRNQKYCSSRS